jgi:hypothetical protein
VRILGLDGRFGRGRRSLGFGAELLEGLEGAEGSAAGAIEAVLERREAAWIVGGGITKMVFLFGAVRAGVLVLPHLSFGVV